MITLLGAIHKPRGQIFGYFDPILPFSWTSCLNTMSYIYSEVIIQLTHSPLNVHLVYEYPIIIMFADL